MKISRTAPTIVRVETVFGSVTLPDGNTVSFGNFTYKNKACESAGNSAACKTVFGSTIGSVPLRREIALFMPQSFMIDAIREFDVRLLV